MYVIGAEQKRFLSLLEIVGRKGDLLLKTDARLFKANLDAAWVERLKNEEDLAERLDAFVSRFGRMQDTLGDKLIPSLLRTLAEKLGLLISVVEWLDARNLRNKLVYEYMADAEEFAAALNQAHIGVKLLVDTYNAINLFAQSRIPAHAWPNLLPGGCYSNSQWKQE